MKTIYKIMLVIAMTFASFALSAQTKDFRTPGYKGSVSLIDQYGVWAGLETSHGVMFDRHIYLGLGSSVSVCLPELDGGNTPVFGNLFVDFQGYILDRKSTPVLGYKAGFMKTFNMKESNTNAVFIEPNVGWSWIMKNGCGFTTSIGAAVYKALGPSTNNFVTMPKLSLTFEF